MIMNTLVNNLSAPPIIPSKYTLSDMEKRQYASVCIFGDFGALKPITTNAANNNAAKAIVTEMTGRESQGPMVLAKHMAKPSNGGSVVHVRRGPNAWVLQARAQIRSSEQQMDTAFGRLATACAERIEKMGPQKPVKVKGRWTTRAFSQKELKAEKERVLWLKNRRNDLTIEPNVIEHIEVPDDGPHVSLGTLMRDTEVLKKTKKVLAPVRGHCALECDIANLLHETLKIFGSRGKPVEVIEKGKRTRISNVRRGKRWYIRCFLPHMRGEKLAQELNRTSNLESLVRVYNRKFNRDVEVDMRSIKPGDSGIVYNGELLRGQRVETEHFIVRGKLNGRLIDARSYMEVEDLLSIKEFSKDVATQFWDGLNRKFLQARNFDDDHKCESNLSVAKCGEVAGLLIQAIYPCGRITCKKCIARATGLTRLEYGSFIGTRVKKVKEEIRADYKDFTHIPDILTHLERATTTSNDNLDDFSAINTIVFDKKESPFSHIREINDVLMKSGEATNADFEMATHHLLEVTRYLKNRTDIIAESKTARFRNKASAKTHFNADLMCDNRLDKNGNFLWGQRGYHAKRFLLNYFERIDPDKGYAMYVDRRHPNGIRKLSIDKLIVSTNLETFRQQMAGRKVHSYSITDECVSKRGGSYVYQNCCVTHDDGTPVESGFLSPTKHHLVIGNTGEAKFVDLPQDEILQMYIAKDGYCYINIFFAMLINVREDQAKSFTKMVRDMIIPKLGVWPTVMDVATTCKLLTVFFPDTANAELPRIYVDHAHKMMHVIDSYGSYDTGYHLLKSNTVSQFMNFSSIDMESELKYYRVGGKFVASHLVMTNFNTLIKAIYRADLMRDILTHEPYLVMLAVLSPGVLLALFNSGSLEVATRMWIRQDQNIAQIMTMLSILAAKVSVSKVLLEQKRIIEMNAEHLLRATDHTFFPCKSIDTAICALTVMDEEHKSDQALRDNGFYAHLLNSSEILEKSYMEDLEASWLELSLWARLRLIFQSRKLHKKYLGFVELENRTGTIGRYSTSLSACLTMMKHNFTRCVKKIKSKTKTRMYNIVGRVTCAMVGNCKYLFPDLVHFMNVLTVLGFLLTIYRSIFVHIAEYKSLKAKEQASVDERNAKIAGAIYKELGMETKILPTIEEFRERLGSLSPELLTWFDGTYKLEDYIFQAKTDGERNLERVVAVSALLLMIFDAERSDVVYKILNKLKTLIGVVETEPMKFQSLDDARDILEEKNLTVDFELQGDNECLPIQGGTTFEQWWNHQLLHNNVIPHYRTEGHFIEFTRESAVAVANEIAHGPHTDYLVRGAVGSGKSTGLLFHLSAKGGVLLLEPTKPLAENVYKQLRKEPFFLNPTLRMRGTTYIGSAPVTIMTSGFALHYYANNIKRLEEIKHIIFDECHVHDSNAMAFRCLLSEYAFCGKILKVSATPPGREIEFTTQKPVELLIEENLSIQQFVSNLGSKSNSDVTAKGDSILVYVASYNEVDQLSKLLLEKNFKVTKVDGRTMKSGRTEIETHGTSERKHFIVATNIIENGVTLDIDVVVDFGTKVVPELDGDARLIRYRKVSVSYGERIQRLGRVGRFKPGVALRIGSTERGLQAVPGVVATEAAFHSFTYGLPVMTEGVSTSILSNCTVPQARTMMNFELPIFFTAPLVRFDGTMHAAVHKLLIPYKLRDSDITLNRLAIPTASQKGWNTAREYAMHGCRLNVEDEITIPFYARDIPEKLISELHTVVVNNKSDSGFGRVSSASAARIAYTLQTDPCSIQRTIAIIDKLIEAEQRKKAYFDSVTGISVSTSNFSLSSIINAIKTRHMTNHTAENIGVLQAAKGQLMEFRNITLDWETVDKFGQNGALECLHFQSEVEMSKHLRLKGHWNKSLITTDTIVAGTVFIGGVWMLYTHFKDTIKQTYSFQAKNKRQRQKLKFRQARDNKHAIEVYGDDANLEHYFGSAYTAKGKSKGNTCGMGTKIRRFVNMYGFDVTDYSFARYVDPLTGATIDENPLTDLGMVQEHFGKVRTQFISDDQLDPNQVRLNTKIEAYFVKNAAKEVLKVDLTPHNPLQLGDIVPSISGFPERELELRQTGKPVLIPYSQLPERNEKETESLVFESASNFHGLRDYNPIAMTVCSLQNTSDGVVATLFGIGYGSVIIANQHLFRCNNGTLCVKSHHGEFKVANTTELQLFPVNGRDIILIKLPKDFPPFPRKLKFRCVEKGERVCLVGSNFQTRSISSTVSETSVTAPSPSEAFTKHWITTKDGQCGLPIVSTKDGKIIGLHSLSSTVSSTNMFTNIPSEFEEKVLMCIDSLEWTKKWRLNVDKANWGAVNIKDDLASGLFKLSKDISSIHDSEWNFQAGFKQNWLYEQLDGNLKAIGRTPNALVTKHVVRGKCNLFAAYLALDKQANDYFTPLLGSYQKSRLNREAYIKDVKKYASPIIVGSVDCDAFEEAFKDVIKVFTDVGFKECAYITDHVETFDALNKKAATGALYKGKKGEYLAGYSESEKEEMLKESCKRLFLGKMGVWNGSLKAELRPIEKCIANKTRSFTAAPIDTLLGGKTCVDDFNNQFYSLHFALPSSVGMTKFYGGWNDLLCRLPDNYVYCDADGSQFDSSLSPYLINAVLNLRLHFMEDWGVGHTMLENLYTEIVYTPIATPDGTIIKKFKGNNSGQPSTVVDNTIMVMLAVNYALRVNHITESAHDFIRYYINGDDLLIAIRPDMEHLLDKFQESFQQLGLNYTFNSRTRNKTELWFMSHQGILRDGIFIPKLERERVVSILEWDRAELPEHRLEAICAAMIEAWGHDELIHEVRRFYHWVLQQEPYNELAAQGKAPYISEVALKALYTGTAATESELVRYYNTMERLNVVMDDEFCFQADRTEQIDAGRDQVRKRTQETNQGEGSQQAIVREPDVNVGSAGALTVPRLREINSKINLPMVRGKRIVNLDHLLLYTPQQTDIYNTRATQTQFAAWYDGVKQDYELEDDQMQIVLNGLMVWCIENGTSPNLNGMWVMMDEDKQVEFPIKPLLDHAKPTFRQIMAHFSELAEAYIIKRNITKPYMPRYALKRNLTDMSLAQYAFDFLEITSRTPARAREAQAQMKAAALKNARTRMFGLDGSVGTTEEDTERHTTTDVNRSMHSMLGIRM